MNYIKMANHYLRAMKALETIFKESATLGSVGDEINKIAASGLVDSESDINKIDAELLFEIIRDGLIEIAKKELGGFVEQLLADIRSFINQSAPQIIEWVEALKNHQMSEFEFKFLISGIGELAAMHALTQVGIVLSLIEKIKKAVLDLLISSVLKVLVV